MNTIGTELNTHKFTYFLFASLKLNSANNFGTKSIQQYESQTETNEK